MRLVVPTASPGEAGEVPEGADAHEDALPRENGAVGQLDAGRDQRRQLDGLTHLEPTWNQEGPNTKG